MLFFRICSLAGDQGVAAAAAPREAPARHLPGIRRLLHRVVPGRHVPRRVRLWQEQRARVPGLSVCLLPRQLNTRVQS